MHANRLGNYLTARRALISPADAGLPLGDGPRRVDGLRREEVAELAGISSQYYLRLEQGRDQHPSDQVLVALVRALQLNRSSADYLFLLAHSPPSLLESRPSEEVEDRTRWLVDSWDTPAVVHSRYLDVVASNAAARALSPFFAEGFNSLGALLLQPSMRDFYQDWEGIAERSVALLRVMAGPDTGDRRLAEIVDELTGGSEIFRRVWSRSDVEFTSTGTHRVSHPVMGELELHHKKLEITGTHGQSIFVYHATPGSPTEQALALHRR